MTSHWITCLRTERRRLLTLMGHFRLQYLLHASEARFKDLFTGTAQ